MVSKKSKRIKEYKTAAMTSNKEVVNVPDAAIYYIVNRYIESKVKDGMSVVPGISTNDVTSVLGFFVEWCASNGYIHDGKLVIGNN
jgi:hypothetical protein